MEGKQEGVECVDWFFCTRELSAETIEEELRSKA